MVSIVQYQYYPESDPESGDEHDSYKTFLNGNLPMTLYTFVLHNSIKLTGYYIQKQRWHWFTFFIKLKNNVIKYIFMKNTFTKLVHIQNSSPKCLYAFVVDTK